MARIEINFSGLKPNEKILNCLECEQPIEVVRVVGDPNDPKDHVLALVRSLRVEAGQSPACPARTNGQRHRTARL